MLLGLKGLQAKHQVDLVSDSSARLLRVPFMMRFMWYFSCHGAHILYQHLEWRPNYDEGSSWSTLAPTKGAFWYTMLKWIQDKEMPFKDA